MCLYIPLFQIFKRKGISLFSKNLFQGKEFGIWLSYEDFQKGTNWISLTETFLIAVHLAFLYTWALHKMPLGSATTNKHRKSQKEWTIASSRLYGMLEFTVKRSEKRMKRYWQTVAYISIILKRARCWTKIRQFWEFSVTFYEPEICWDNAEI